nr:MAG TPA: hypothetical protein [Caudoviricetes sp.]
MNKCFVTKLKKSVQSTADLPYFGEVTMTLKNDRNDDNAVIVVQTASDGIMFVSENKNLSFTSTTSDLTNKLIVPPNSKKEVYFGGNEETYTVKLVSKYANDVILSNKKSVSNKIVINIDDLKYTNFKKLDLWGFPLVGNISSIATMDKLTVFRSTYDSLVGDISSLKEKRNLTLFGAYSSKVIGDISNLSNNVGLTSIILLNNGITGKIESLVEPLFKGKEDNNSVLRIICNEHVTLNNVVVGNNVSILIEFFNTRCTIKKDNVTIATYENNAWTYESIEGMVNSMLGE